MIDFQLFLGRDAKNAGGAGKRTAAQGNDALKHSVIRIHPSTIIKPHVPTSPVTRSRCCRLTANRVGACHPPHEAVSASQPQRGGQESARSVESNAAAGSHQRCRPQRTQCALGKGAGRRWRPLPQAEAPTEAEPRRHRAADTMTEGVDRPGAEHQTTVDCRLFLDETPLFCYNETINRKGSMLR